MADSLQFLAQKYLAAYDSLARALDAESAAKRVSEETSTHLQQIAREIKQSMTADRRTVVITGDGTRMIVVSPNLVSVEVAEIFTGADTPTQEQTRGFWLDTTTAKVVDAPETVSLVNVRYCWLAYNRHRGYFVDSHGRAWKEVPQEGIWTLV